MSRRHIMKLITQETNKLTSTELQILALLKEHENVKVSLFSLSKSQKFQNEQNLFYLPLKNEIILNKPFVDERKIFHLLFKLESFIIQNAVEKITVITTAKESTLSHPFADVKFIPYDIWASEI